jgi:LuxR family maltose regulon positive regulatory protein
LALLDAAEKSAEPGPLPELWPVAAQRARLFVRQGRPADALRWARGAGLTADDAPEFLRAFELATLARALVADGRSRRDRAAVAAGVGLAERLAAASRGAAGVRFDALLAVAVGREAAGDRAGALAALDEALAFAEAAGVVRAFADEGAAMARLLAEAAGRGETGFFAARLLPVCEAYRPRGAPALPEPLTARETEILRLIGLGLSNQEIAERLFLALNTVKGHNRVLFDKLQVARRTEAVARARELGLI